MKKILGIIVIVFSLFISAVGVYAAEFRVMLDDQYVDIAPPVIVDGRSLLPVRDIVELLGGSVDWDGVTKQVTITKDNTTVLLAIDNKTAKVNDNDVLLDVPPQIINGKTMIPLRFVGESLGVGVGSGDGVIFIYTNTEKDNAATTPTVIPVIVPVPAEAPSVTPAQTSDTNSKLTVFWGNTGDKIHISPDCRTITNGSLSGSLDEAKAAGHTNGWCGVCSKGWTDERFLKDGNPNIK